MLERDVRTRPLVDWSDRRGYGLEDLGDPERGPQVMRRYAQRLGRWARSDDGIAPNTARTYYTTEGARSRLQTLSAETEIDVGEDADYLQPHGAHGGMIGEVFTRDRGEAQRERLDGLTAEIE